MSGSNGDGRPSIGYPDEPTPSYRYTLIGADKCGVFFEHRLDDALELLRERDRHTQERADAGHVRDVLFEVIDNDAVDPPERGVVTWCEHCLAEPTLERAGDESLCEKCAALEEQAS